jgi:hypothetical protein
MLAVVSDREWFRTETAHFSWAIRLGRPARVVALSECGTHAFLAAQIGPYLERQVVDRGLVAVALGERLHADHDELPVADAGGRSVTGIIM